jgi:hypothetical protein
MSARKGDERLETIEIYLKDFSIAQCRGYHNLDSPYHKQILELLRKNLKNIEKTFYNAIRTKPAVKRKQLAA